jgi:hypothetical protein
MHSIMLNAPFSKQRRERSDAPAAVGIESPTPFSAASRGFPTISFEIREVTQ